MKTLADFYSESDKFVNMFNSFVKKHNLIGNTQADHICYKCGSREKFEEMRKIFEDESEYIYQSIISKRRIDVVRLKKGIETFLGKIYFVELSDQKPDGSQKDGFDHIEAYPVGRTYEDMLKKFEASEKVIKVERPHHTTHDINIGKGFLFRCTQGPLIEKIKNSEMV